MVAIFGIVLQSGAQNSIPAKWNSEKIRGERFKPYVYYDGEAFYTTEWCSGSITLSSGEVLDSLSMKYSSFEDDLIYFNNVLNASIKIDKEQLNGFTMNEKNGTKHLFRKQPSPRNPEKILFFEELYKGETDLLCYRRVELTTTSPYFTAGGIQKNQKYTPTYIYYFYNPQKGFCTVRPKRASLFAQFGKEEKKQVRKHLRKEHIVIIDETSFSYAWASLDKAGFVPLFRSEEE